MSRNQERFLWLTKGQFVGVLSFVCLACITLALGGLFYSIGTNHETSERLCANQHSLVEMQKLFLEEHAAIREQLEDAGIPNAHADPDLLVRLGVLIEAADCSP